VVALKKGYVLVLEILAIMLISIGLSPLGYANNSGSVLPINISTEEFTPMIWLCDNRLVGDDNVEPGRITAGGEELAERINNYAFEGEQITWDVLVLDKNGIEKIEDVYISVGTQQADGNFVEANCQLQSVIPEGEDILESCNAMIDEEDLDEAFADSMAYYTCTLTVESPGSMFGPRWITANVVDLDGHLGTMTENEFWFFNPTVSLTMQGMPLSFGVVRPGTVGYSNTLLVGNGAQDNSGVLLDMFISGTDFTDDNHTGAKCPTTNQLALTNFRYYAVNGAYSTQNDAEVNTLGVVRNKDAEGYMNIEYGNYFTTNYYDDAEIIQSAVKNGPYYIGNLLSPRAEMSLTFKVNLPLPCNGDFSHGSIFFWGEAV
jgi:hypothetical protein